MKPHAIITGAAEGIGRALASRFGSEGYAIVGVDINMTLATQTQTDLARQNIDIVFQQANLGVASDLRKLATTLINGPAIDLLIHNAGINCVGPFATSDIAAQQAVLDINLKAPFQLTAALLHANKIARGGTIVFISSLSRWVGYPGAAGYAASKDGLASYARSLAVALAPQGIHVLTVCPGPTRTAHARRYSPDNTHETRRMSPDILAMAINHAVKHHQRTLIPGLGNQLSATLGRWAPSLAEWAMQKTLWEKIKAGSTQPF